MMQFRQETSKIMSIKYVMCSCIVLLLNRIQCSYISSSRDWALWIRSYIIFFTFDIAETTTNFLPESSLRIMSNTTNIHTKSLILNNRCEYAPRNFYIKDVRDRREEVKKERKGCFITSKNMVEGKREQWKSGWWCSLQR